MIKLSQKGWNNVIIFVTLGLILLFNFSSKFLNRNIEVNDIGHLVAPHQVITTIEYPEYKIERIGQGWRTNSQDLNKDQLFQIPQRWQEAEVEPFSHPVVWDSQAISVTLWLAGQAEPQVYRFLPLADKVLVNVHQQTYQLSNHDYSQLFVEP
jgi:hypothetical protein